MRKRWKRRLAWLLCAAICLTLLPAAALAAEAPTITVAQALERLAAGDNSTYYLRGTVSAAYSAEQNYAELTDPGGTDHISVKPARDDTVLTSAQPGDEILVTGRLHDGVFAAEGPAVIVGPAPDGSRGLDLRGVTWDADFACGGGTAQWRCVADATADNPNVLVLDGVEIDTQKSADGEGVPGVCVPGNTRIVVKGACAVRGGGTDGDGVSLGAIQFWGDGTLAVEAGASLAAEAYGTGCGLRVYGALRVENDGTAEFSGAAGIFADGGVTLAGDGVTRCLGYRGYGINAPDKTVTVEAGARGVAAGAKGGVYVGDGTLTNHSGGGFVTAPLDNTSKTNGLDVTAASGAVCYSNVGVTGTALWVPGDADSPGLLTLDSVSIIAPAGGDAVTVPADTKITARGFCIVTGGAGGHGIRARGALELAVEWDAAAEQGMLFATGGAPGGDGLRAEGGVTLSGPGAAVLTGAHGVYANGGFSVAPEVRGMARGTGTGVTAGGLDNQSKSFLTWEGRANEYLYVSSYEAGAAGLDLTGDAPPGGVTALYTDVGGGSALWVSGADPSADDPNLLILNNAVIAAPAGVSGVSVPADTKIIVRGVCTVEGGDRTAGNIVGRSGVCASGALELAVEAGASLTAAGGRGDFGGPGIEIEADGDAVLTVAAGGSLTARGGDSEGYGSGSGLSKAFVPGETHGVTVRNEGTAVFLGGRRAGEWYGYGIVNAGGGVALSGGGKTICLGYEGVISAAGIDITPGVRGLAAGLGGGISASGGVVNGSAAFLAVDGTTLTDLPAVDGAPHAGGLDLRGASSATLYTDVGGGAALWEPEASRLTLGGAALTGGIALPSGAVELALQGANTVERAGPALTGADVTVLDRSRAGRNDRTYGPDSLLLSNTLGAAVIGEGTLTAALPWAGRYLTLTDGAGGGVSGGAFPGAEEETAVAAAPTDGALTLAYDTLPAGYYVLTVHGGSGAGIYSLGETAALSCPAGDGAGRVFSHWALAEGAPGALSGADGVNASFTMGAGHAAVEAVYKAAPTPAPSGGGGGSSSYTITATAGAGGAIDPAGRTSVPAGGTRTFTVLPEAGYAVSDVLVDGESVGAVASYTFERVDRAHTIEARFAPQSPYADVAQGDWFYDAALYAYGRGLMTGVSEAEFQPGGVVTRATAAAVLYRLEGAPSSPGGGGIFTDVPAGQWYTQAVAWCSGAGLAGGYGDGRFGPGDPVTREQLAAMLYRYAKYKGWDVSAGENSNILSFADAFDVSEWAVPALQWACGAGLMSGKDGGRLDPRGTATRAELAALLMRLLETCGPA
ncbi:hypothetical protein CE91St41_21850 [Oscillospiraceae bacterium]|nr:hypothetical protein CE91St40_15690 [Oscillospiraceae bacterium]BDF75296.1 hypothetical protein CE91St41_21850 [Oscillospiraceae bacterium]